MPDRERCWRAVVSSRLNAGRGGLLGGDTWRRARWWDLTLECEHVTQRTVKYKPLPKDRRQRGGSQKRSKGDVLPAPRRIRCEYCEAEAPRG